MTPTQLRAFCAVVQHGSVKGAAAELGVTEAAVSIHVAHLRKELEDRLFTPTRAGLAFTAGGLRLASRASELLGLQDLTIREVNQAAHGRRPKRVLDSLRYQPFLKYQVVVVAGPGHPLAGTAPRPAQLREQTWLLGPSAAEQNGVLPSLLRRLEVPEQNQQIFQSHAAAIEQAKRNKGVAAVASFAVARDLADGALVRVAGAAGPHADGLWCAMTLPPHHMAPAAAELVRFITTPRAIQAMLRGRGVNISHFRPSVHVTLWN